MLGMGNKIKYHNIFYPTGHTSISMLQQYRLDDYWYFHKLLTQCDFSSGNMGI